MCPFVFNMYYFCGANGKMKHVWDKAPYPVTDATPCLRDVVISDVRARQCTACAGFFYGLAEMPVEGVKMQNVVVEMVDGAPGRPAMMDGCPECSAQASTCAMRRMWICAAWRCAACRATGWTRMTACSLPRPQTRTLCSNKNQL